MTIKKKLLLPLIFLSSLTAGQASPLSLVSGFTNFTKDKDGVIKSNAGGSQLTLNLGSGTIKEDGSLSTKGTTADGTLTDANKTSIDLSSLGLSDVGGYTININFNNVPDILHRDSLFSLNIGGSKDNLLARIESKKDLNDKDVNYIDILNNGSSSARPDSAVSEAIDLSKPFTLTLSVQEGGDYALFVTTQGKIEKLTWAGVDKLHPGTMDKLTLGAWSQLDNQNSEVNISSIGIYSGAATIDNLPPSISVPEPTTASLGLLGLTALLLRRRRAVA